MILDTRTITRNEFIREQEIKLSDLRAQHPELADMLNITYTCDNCTIYSTNDAGAFYDHARYCDHVDWRDQFTVLQEKMVEIYANEQDCDDCPVRQRCSAYAAADCADGDACLPVLKEIVASLKRSLPATEEDFL